MAGKGAKQLTFNQVPLETAGDYAAEDADVTLQLHNCLYPQLQAQPGLIRVYNEIDMPLVRILSQVERCGTLVDGRMLKQHGAELADRLHQLTQEVWALAGENFNLDSPKQLQAILYDKMGLPVLKKTPGGQPSTAEPVLVDLAQDYELPKKSLTYRGLAKLKSQLTQTNCHWTLTVTPVESTPPTIKPLRQLGGCRLLTPICRTSLFATPKAAASAKPLWRQRAAWLPITRKLN